MNPTPAGHEPNRPTADGPLAPTAPGTTPRLTLTRPQKILVAIVSTGVLTIATLGFIGSYNAVTTLATTKHFGSFAHAFPIAVDAGIIAFLSLDLLLTWLRMPYPLLRYGAWLLTAATIAFNAVTAWPDPIGVGMHAVIPILFVVAIEAARHAIGRIADITADKHIEGPPATRWLLNPAGTFILWRRQRLWGIRSWDTVLHLERERRIYIAKMRKQYGRWTWRQKATAEQLLVLALSKDGMSVTEAIALPAKEAEKERQEQARIARAAQEAADKRRRDEETYRLEQERLEDERRRQQEADRLEAERRKLELEQEREAADRQRLIDEAKARAELAEIQRRQREADQAAARRHAEEQAEIERRRRQEQLDYTRRLADEEERAAQAAQAKKNAEEHARQEAERKAALARQTAEHLRAATASQSAASRHTGTASASQSPANGTASASQTVATSPATAAASPARETASPASPRAATNPAPAATASASQSPASPVNGTTSNSGTTDLTKVVEVYRLLKDQDGKPPSDQTLGAALGVSRSRAQQLRTAAIDAGHTELAKPVRLAS